MHGANQPEKSVVANLGGAAKPLPKRQRTAQACVQCNKSKAKCEIEPKVPVCRRCFRLGLPCEFAGGSRPPRAVVPPTMGGGPGPQGALQGYHHSMALHPSPYALAHAVHAGLNPMAPPPPYFPGSMHPGALPPYAAASHFQSPPHLPPRPHHYHPALFAARGGIPSGHGGPSAMPGGSMSSTNGSGSGEGDPGMHGPPFVQSSSAEAAAAAGGALSPSSSGGSASDHHAAAAARHALAAQLSSQHGNFLVGHHPHALGMGPAYNGSGDPSASAHFIGSALSMSSSGAPVANLSSSSSSSPGGALPQGMPALPSSGMPPQGYHHLGGSHWEHGILAALTQNGRTANEVPLELLREWTLVAMHRRDCALLGRTMTLASSCGHSMESLLDSVGALSSLLGTVNGLFMQAVLKAAAPFHPPSAAAEAANAGSESTKGELSASAEGAAGGGGEGIALKEPSVPAADEALFVLPQCTSWIEDGPATSNNSGSKTSRPAQLVLMKQVVNGKVSFFTSKAFEAFVVPKDRIEASWNAKGRPAAELFLHPEDAPVVCAYIGRLWKSLVPSPRPTPPPPPPLPNVAASTSTTATTADEGSSSAGDFATIGGAATSPESSLPPPSAAPSSAAAAASKVIAAAAAGGVVSEQTAAADLPSALRVWVTGPNDDAPQEGGGGDGATEATAAAALVMGSAEECSAGYVPCALRAQVVVSKTTDGQTSLVVLAFRPILTEPVPPPSLPLASSNASSSTADSSSSSSASAEGADSATAAVATKPSTDEEAGAAAAESSSALPLANGARSDSTNNDTTTGIATTAAPSRTFAVGCMGIDGLAGAPPAGSSNDATGLMLATSRNTQFWKRVSVAAAGDTFRFAAS